MRFLILLLLAMLLAPPALAQSHAPAPPAPPAPARQEPIIAPLPDWVQPVAVPAPDPALADRPAQLLLSNSQSLYGADHDDHFITLVYLIQNAQGLQVLGNIVLPWSPNQSDLIVHQVQIIRGGAIIDLLAAGQRFTVLRRENNLESATLDGVLTAVMQPEGLAVGDILKVSWTFRRHGGALPLSAENFFAIPGDSQPVRRVDIRQIWPDSLPMRWHATGLFQAAQLHHTARGSELSVELNDVHPPQLPPQLPGRLATTSMLELSQFRDWAELGALVAPYYQRAAELGPDSPLRAEIARIAASSQDPRARTMAALRLVQDQVRYFALVMGDGNYLPATAEQSWTRRYADCKGKAVLLVALLRGLGIEAEPVLVDSGDGEGVHDRLPMLPAFNHMIVRARLGDRSYWLDGTRTGDRDLDDLASSPFGWGLPVRAAGAALEQLPLAAPGHPLDQTDIVYDGSAGLSGSVPIRLEETMRGDLAVQIRAGISGLGREEFLRQMRQRMTLGSPEYVIETIDLRDDPDAGTLTFILVGHTTLGWNPIPGTAPAGGARRLLFAHEQFTLSLDIDRPDGPFHDAPIALPAPLLVSASETVILPAGGRGFTIEGADFERVIAGTRFTRRGSIADGRASVRITLSRAQREISAAEARASAEPLRALRDDRAYLHAPASALRPAAGRR